MANYINPDRNIVVPGLDPVVNFASFKHRVEDIAAAKTLNVKDSGKVFMINQASAYAITLPAATEAEAGWFATFILGTVAANAVTIIVLDTDGNNIHGHGIDGEDGAAQTVTEGTGVDVITFISGATKGDRVSLICDGTSYYVFSLAADAAHITFS